MNCVSCKNQITETSFVTSRKKGETVHFHVYCYYPQLLQSFKKITKSYVSRALDDLNNYNIDPSLIRSKIDEIDYEDELDDFDEYEEEYDEYEDDIDSDLPSAA